MTTDFVADVTTWIVLTTNPNLLTVEVGQQFTTGQPCEVFSNETDATERATELGWTQPDEVIP